MKYRLLFVFIVVLSFVGCSVAVPVYIQNETADSVLVEVRLQKPSESVYKIPILLNETDVLKAAKQFQKGITDSLSFAGKDSIWHFSIPPKSIIMLETAMNFGSLNFQSVRVSGKEISKLVAADHFPFYDKEIPSLQVQRKGLRYEFLSF